MLDLQECSAEAGESVFFLMIFFNMERQTKAHCRGNEDAVGHLSEADAAECLHKTTYN